MAAKLSTLSGAFAALVLVFTAPAQAALPAPAVVSPGGGAVVESLPAFVWKAVSGADHYEFQFAADSGFNSPVLGRGEDSFATRNLRATLKKTIPNGTYWWRVRAVTAEGAVSSWSPGRSLVKRWSGATALQAPAGSTTLTFPFDPLVLGWSPVPGAAHYLVSLASDPQLGSLVFTTLGSTGAPKVQANTLAVGAALAPGAYYWSVTPVDAQGNRGVPTPVASFNWSWPSATTAHVTDLNDALEVYDPKFFWDAVPGAARYEVEVNPSSDFAPGSKVCCSGTTINTSLSPTLVFKDNTFYWRVRAIDTDDNAGVWNYGPSFTKAFDKVPPVAGTSIKNLRMRDNLNDPGSDQDLAAPGYQTQVPLVTWDAVPGASSYEVDVTTYGGGLCDWAATSHHWRVNTAVTAWTPLGSGWFASKPYSDPMSVANDFQTLIPGQYCARVRARSDRAFGDEVYGDYTYLDPNALGWAFQWTSYPTGGACSPSCTANYLGANDYLRPQTGTTTGSTPYFTWKAIAGKQSYYVLVSKDANFSNIVDYGFTQVPAYAPRDSFGPRTYSDETTLYYWAVLPANGADGSGAVGNPLLAAAQSFQKQSTPPTQTFPEGGHVFFDQPTFRWTPTLGARQYRLQVSQDPSFGNPLDDVTTDSTAYSSNTTYPADTVLYWRVRATDENGVGLTWSATGTFQKKLAAPVPSATNPTVGETLPVLSWAPVAGAVSYDFSIDEADGDHRDFSDFRMPAISWEKFTGTGILHWRVRAEFPKAGFGTVPGPWSPLQAFTHVIGEPTGPKTDSSRDHVLLSWNAKLGIKNYRVQISARPDFSLNIEDVTTDNTSYAPRLQDIGYLNGGPLFWRVAGVDEDSNVGDFTQPQPINLLPQLKLRLSGKLRRRRWMRVTVYVSKPTGLGMSGASVRVLGAGVKTQTRRTGRWGSVTFRLRPSRRGRVLFRATKPGYQAAARVLLVK